MVKGLNYQDQLLNNARKENIIITVFLVNGFQIRGLIRMFDQYVIFLEVEGKQQMVYKHAVSTIIPARPVKIEVATGDNE